MKKIYKIDEIIYLQINLFTRCIENFVVKFIIIIFILIISTNFY